jgi:hypothetical protein
MDVDGRRGSGIRGMMDRSGAPDDQDEGRQRHHDRTDRPETRAK